MPGREPVGAERSLLIAAAPTRVLSAFFDPDGLAAWWQAIRSVTTPRPLGVYAVEWAPTEYRDDILGPLGGVFHGTVIEFKPGREFFVGNAYWLPPEGDPIGPMALDVTCAFQSAPPGGRPATLLRIQQSGYEDSPRWTRYYELIARGWSLALDSLREYLESRPVPRTDD